MALTDHPRPAAAALAMRRTAVLAIGDALAFMIFAAIGRASHSEAAGLDAILQIAETAAPFAISWFVVAPLTGAFKAETSDPRSMLMHSALAWLLAWPLGLALRALFRHSGIPITFAIITLITVMIILLGWRGAFAWLTARRNARTGGAAESGRLG